MAETLYGSLNMTNILNSTPKVAADLHTFGGTVRTQVETVEITAAACVTSTYYLGRFLSHAVILPQSTIYWDDVGTGGATLDIGDSNDPDGLATDIAIDGSASNTGILEAIGIEEYGKPLWELLGYSADPKTEIDVYGTLATADASAGGTLSAVWLYTDGT